MKPVATQSSFQLFLVSSVCGCGDCCHPVGLEGSSILTRTGWLGTLLLVDLILVRPVVGWHVFSHELTHWFQGLNHGTSFMYQRPNNHWPNNCSSHGSVFSIIQGFFLQHFFKDEWTEGQHHTIIKTERMKSQPKWPNPKYNWDLFM